MITGMNELETLTKHISSTFQCKNLTEHHLCKKDYIENPAKRK